MNFEKQPRPASPADEWKDPFTEEQIDAVKKDLKKNMDKYGLNPKDFKS